MPIPMSAPLSFSAGAASLLAALALAMLLSGCATVETQRAFERPAANRFLPGVTTRAAVLAVYGAPGRSRTWAGNTPPPGQAVRFPFGQERVPGALAEIDYVYIAPNATATRPGIEATRTLTFWFWQDRLAGYLGTSSFRRDATVFDERHVNALRAGKATRRDVLRALGPPAGILTHPLVRGEGNEVLIWESDEFDRFRNESKRRRLDILVDAAGAVVDLRFGSSRTPSPAPTPTILVPPTYTPPPVFR